MPSFTGYLRPEPFTISIPDSALAELDLYLGLSKLPRPTYQSSQSSSGATNEWIAKAKDTWQNDFNWRTYEAHLNEYPNYTVGVQDDDGRDYSIHFIGMMSESNRDAVPLLLLHGWPSSFAEFVPMLRILAASTSPAFHIIVPSLPGFGFSSSPPVDKDFGMEDVARLMDKLMVGLGFGNGYVVQGGDIGSFVARMVAVNHSACKAVHLNFCPMQRPQGMNDEKLSEQEKIGLVRAEAFMASSTGYGLMHATQPNTMSHILTASPIALLTWIGEKLVEQNMPLETILENVSLYWFTQTYPTSIYMYRQIFAPGAALPPENPIYYIHKPLGYSWFPHEIMPIPQSWVAKTGELLFYRYHDQGGHFAAQTDPRAFSQDLQDFFGIIADSLTTLPASPPSPVIPLSSSPNSLVF